MNAVCRFIGIEYEPAMCAYSKSGAKTVNVSREPWKARATGPIDPSRLDRWRKELPPQMVAQIEAVAWPEMKRLGYSPQTPLLRRLVVGVYAWPYETLRVVVSVIRRRLI
jgi:hypothetical protein